MSPRASPPDPAAASEDLAPGAVRADGDRAAADVEPESIVEAPSLRKAAGFLVFAGICVGLAILAGSTGWFSKERLDDWRAWISGLGGWGPVAFVALNAIAVAVGVPRLFFATAGGALFGFVAGALLAQWGAMFGSVITFSVGRALGRGAITPWVTARFPKARAVFATVERHGFAANVLLRWAPVGHSFTSNLLMAVSRVSARDFLLGTFVGLLPYSLVAALLGSAAKGEDTVMRIATSVGGALALTVFVGWWIRRRRRSAGA